MNNINQLLRELRFAVNSEDHTPEEWRTILGYLNTIGQKANIRLQLTDGTFLEIVEKDVDTDEKSV